MVKVSIIIPVYNVEPYLKQCLDSVVNQTLEDIEAICVDDCSPDDSGRILDEYAAKDKRIKVFHLEKNSGAGVARNYALDKANGKYIMFLDPDDWYELNACELAYNQIEKNKNDTVFFGMYLYDNQTGEKEEDKHRLSGLLPYMDNLHINLSEIDTPFIKTTEMVYRIYPKKFLDDHNIRFGNVRCGEDIIFAMKSFVHAKDISILNVPLYNYRINNNKSVTHNILLWKEHFDCRYSVYKYLEKNAPKNIVNAWLVRYIRSLIYWYKRYSSYDRQYEKEIYTAMRTTFLELNGKYDISIFKKYIDFSEFKKIVKNPYWKYYLLTLLKNLRQRVLPHKKRKG